MLLERNRRIKAAPQRFQDSDDCYDIIITCEERCFTLVHETLSLRPIRRNRPVHLVNFDIRDTPEDAMVGARAILVLAQSLAESEDLDQDAETIIHEYVKSKATHSILYSVLFY